MSHFDSTLRTLRQAQGAMRPAPAKTVRQLAILRALPEGRRLDYRQIGDEVNVELPALAATLHYMHEKKLLDRIGEAGEFRYGSTVKGRAFLEDEL